MKKYVIERDIPGVDKMGESDLSGAAKTSNAALAQLAPKVQWVQSYVAKDKTFCIYLAENEDHIREHARISGLSATFKPISAKPSPARRLQATSP